MLLAVLAVTSSPAYAGVFVWTGGGGDNNWSTGANWMGGVAPPANQTDTAVEFDGAKRLMNTQNIANKMSLNGITFDKNAGAAAAGFNLGGMPVTMVSDAGNNPTITNNTTTAPRNTISMDMEFSNPTTITGNGSANLVLSGALGGTSGFTLDSSTFQLTLSGNKANGYGGTTTLNKGRLVLNKGANNVTAIPQDLVIGNGTATARVTMKEFSNQIGKDSNVTVNTNGSLTIATPSGMIGLTDQIKTLSGSGNVNLGSGPGAPGAGRNTLLTDGKGMASPFSGVISGTGNLTKTGDGELVLTGANTYTGNTTVKSGVLTVNGSIGAMKKPTGNIDASGGTLKGDGKIFPHPLAMVKGVTIGANGTIHPGNSPGILTIGSGGFDMLKGSLFDEEIDRGPSGSVACDGVGCYSQLDVIGGTTLENSTLSVTLDSALKVGDLFAIIYNMDSPPITGTFAGLEEDGTFTVDFGNQAYLFEISYDGNAISPSLVTFDGGNDVVLKVISASPVREPGTLMLLGGGLLGLGIVRRRTAIKGMGLRRRTPPISVSA